MPKKPKDHAAGPDDGANDPLQSPGGNGDFMDPTDESNSAQASAHATDPDGADEDEQDVYVESAQAELDEARERAVRLQAELENYRKRAQRTLDEERKYASLPLMRDLLTVVDNLQRAIEAAKQNEGSAGLLEGVEMVASQLISILQQHHCEEIPAQGTPFDPNMHEAIAQWPSDEHDAGAVMQVTQTGYQLYDRVVRPAQVIVATAKSEEE